MKSIRPVLVLAAIAVIGCAPAGTTSDTSRQGPAPRSSNILTAEEIATFHADVPTAYDAVARLRPNWLLAHGVVSREGPSDGSEYALVFVDGHHYGARESLRNIQAYQVDEIRFYNVAQAVAHFGVLGGSSGVIGVRMKSPSRR